VIDGNWFYGGGFFQVYLYGTNLTVTNNKFSRTQGLQYPPVAYRNSGQVWHPMTHFGNKARGKWIRLLND